ncbi:MAG: tol-pal system protein YbgF [Alphaproteobacteria bacterium]
MNAHFADRKLSWRTAAILTVLGCVLTAAPVSAEPSEIDSMREHADRLRLEAQSVRRDVQIAQIQPGAAAVIENRLNQIEKQLQDMTARLEDLSFQQRKLTDQNERFRADVEQRLETLERGRPGQVTPARPTPPATTQPMTTQPVPPPQRLAQQPQPRAPLDWEGRKPTSPNAPTRLTPEPDADPDEPPDNPALTYPPATQPRANRPSVADNTTGAVLPEGSPDQQFQYAVDLLRASEYDAAIDALRAFMRKYPTSPRNGDAYYWLGEAYFVRARYREAAVQFAEGYQKYKAHPKAPETLLKLGMSMSRMNKRPEACAAFTEMRTRFPKLPPAIQQTAATERRKAGCA